MLSIREGIIEGKEGKNYGRRRRKWEWVQRRGGNE
jgi:hypothetical protein